MNHFLDKLTQSSLSDLLVYFGAFQFFLIICAFIFFVQPQFLLRIRNDFIKSICSVIGIIFLLLNFICAVVCGALYQIYLYSGLGG